jgi:hypothetical protein
MKKTRLLTVGHVYYDLALTIERIPYIRLCGKWLEAAGFQVGDLISVEPQKDGLLIRRMDRLQLLTNEGKNKTGPTGKRLMREITKQAVMTLPVKEKARRKTRSQK